MARSKTIFSCNYKIFFNRTGDPNICSVVLGPCTLYTTLIFAARKEDCERSTPRAVSSVHSCRQVSNIEVSPYDWHEMEITGTLTLMEPLDPKAIAALADERVVMEETETDQAVRLLRQNLVPAVASICSIACYSENERLRLQAATYVVERNLGRVQDAVIAQAKDPFKDFLADCIENVSRNGN